MLQVNYIFEFEYIADANFIFPDRMIFGTKREWCLMAMKDAIPRFSRQRKKPRPGKLPGLLYIERENEVALRQAISQTRALPSCRLRPSGKPMNAAGAFSIPPTTFSQLAPPG
ncbi:hypothetical protein [Herbaspirillum lusitanum]|uniref:hypothetical protein n=1 Tax=Herbaspirillum lusitanum TaxID=213312 RepID=UPI00036C2DC0|nr:hypothetical protein [Herbaspirillum lusitanum]